MFWLVLKLSMRVSSQTPRLSAGIFWPNKARHQRGGQIHLCRRHSTVLSWSRALPPSVPCFIIVLCSRPRPLLTPFATPPPPPPPPPLYLLYMELRDVQHIHLLPNPTHHSPPKQLADCRLECLQLPSNLGHEAPALAHHGQICK